MTLVNDNAPFEAVVVVVNGVVVVLARPRGRQWIGLTALARSEESDHVDFRTVAMVRIRTSLNVVRHIVVIHEHDAAADDDVRFERNESELRDRHAGGI